MDFDGRVLAIRAVPHLADNKNSGDNYPQASIDCFIFLILMDTPMSRPRPSQIGICPSRRGAYRR